MMTADMGAEVLRIEFHHSRQKSSNDEVVNRGRCLTLAIDLKQLKGKETALRGACFGWVDGK